MARKDSNNQKRSMSAMFRGRAIFKPLNTGRIDERVACVREWVANIFFYTRNGVTIMIDAGYNYARLRLCRSAMRAFCLAAMSRETAKRPSSGLFLKSRTTVSF